MVCVWWTQDSEVSRHPVFGELVERYMAAIQAWRCNPQVRKAAQVLGMSRREYCDRYVSLNFSEPLTWSSSSTSTSDLLGPAHFSEAYDKAGKALARARH